MSLMVSGADLPPLAWASHGFTFDSAAWRPITNCPGWTIKPLGGLWTSPMHVDGGTHWTQWCEREDYDKNAGPLVPIVPAADATVFRVHSLDDLRALCARYPIEVPARMRMWPTIDWEKAAAEIDAVWLTEEGQYATRYSEPGLYGWDCATVLWLQPRFRTP